MGALEAELDQLLTSRPGPVVSITMPTHRAGPEIRQDAIRLKNLVRAAEHRLASYPGAAGDPVRVLEPAAALVGDHGFWRHHEDGLAVFAAPGFFRYYRVSRSLPESICVGARFHVKPLLPALAWAGHYFILALSQHEVRLIEASRDSAREIDVADLPRMLDDSLQYDTSEQRLEHHVEVPIRGHRRAPFHGHGESAADRRQHILTVFQRVDAAIRQVMADRRAPLVLAAVDDLMGLYKEANSHPGLVVEGLSGNPQGISAEALRKRGWAIVCSQLDDKWREPAARHAALAGTGRTVEDVTTVLPAAFQGRVDQLFVCVDAEDWGVFDPETGIVRLDAEPHPDSEELLNLAVVYVLKRGGTVHGVGRGQVPAGGLIAAILRY